MWKAAAGTNVKVNQTANNGDADEWETDPDFVNDVSEKEQRWGAKTVEGSGHQASMKLDKLREEVTLVALFSAHKLLQNKPGVLLSMSVLIKECSTHPQGQVENNIVGLGLEAFLAFGLGLCLVSCGFKYIKKL